tara:strand:- start:137 stop:529 length:393 start_codon:yes stop_codon:yes gene_type:complete
MSYSKGVSWIGDCRIPFVDSDKETINFDRPRLREKKDWVYDLGTTWENPDVKEYNQQGRFTPNLLVCDDMLNDGNVSKTGFNPNANIKQYRGGNFGGGKTNDNGINYSDKGSSSRYYDLDMWFNKMIDEL